MTKSAGTAIHQIGKPQYLAGPGLGCGKITLPRLSMRQNCSQYIPAFCPRTKTARLGASAVHYGESLTLPGMTEDDLTCEQAAKLGKQVGECLRYIGRLRERMEE